MRISKGMILGFAVLKTGLPGPSLGNIVPVIQKNEPFTTFSSCTAYLI